MSLIHRLQRRFGRLAVPNLTVVIIVGQIALYMLQMMQQGARLDRILLIPELVLQGEVWRLITFIFTPPAVSPIFVIFFWMLFYIFGTALETQWGVFRYNLFLLIGYVANVGAAFIAHGFGYSDLPTNGFLYGTVFLAFARLFPDYVLYIMFILPVKVKWLALLQWVFYGYSLLAGPWIARLLVIASVLNYLLFFGKEHWQDFRFGVRRRAYQAKAKRTSQTPRHVCTVCGVNSKESPRTLFRYCSKCAGDLCYCPDHIQDHEHVTQKEPA